MHILAPQTQQETGDEANLQPVQIITLSNSKELESPEFLHEKYLEERRSLKNIARLCGHSKSTVKAALVRHGINLRDGKVKGWRTGQVPYGFKEKNGFLIKHKEEQKILRRIINARKNGKSLHKIADFLNQNQIKTKNGKKWHANTIKQILEKISAGGHMCAEENKSASAGS